MGKCQSRKMPIVKRTKLRGRGPVGYIEWTGAIPTETVDIEVSADGTVDGVFRKNHGDGAGAGASYTQLHY